MTSGRYMISSRRKAMDEQTLLEIEDYQDIVSNIDFDELAAAESTLDKRTKRTIDKIESELLRHLTTCFVVSHRAGDRVNAKRYSRFISRWSALRTEELVESNPNISSEDIRKTLISEGANVPVELTT